MSPAVSSADECSRHVVLFVEMASHMGGVQHSTWNVAKTMDPSRWYPIVLVPEEGDLPSMCRDAGVDVHISRPAAFANTSFRLGRVRVPNLFGWLWNFVAVVLSSIRLSRLLRTIKPDVVVTKGLLPHFYGGIAAKALGVPVVWHAQDFISERFLGLNRRVFGVISRAVPSQVIADSQTIALQLPHSVQSRTTVILNAVNTTSFNLDTDRSEIRDAFRFSPKSIVFGSVARLTPWKGQHLLVEAFSRVRKEIVDCRLLLVGTPMFDGDNYSYRLKRMVAELGIERDVVFAGYRHDLPDVLSTIDVFVHPSVEKDTSPLAVLSALAAGLPVVGFEIEGMCEVLGGTGAGILVKVGDAEALADALLRLAKDSQFRAAMGESGKELARTSFRLEEHVREIEAVLESTLATASEYSRPDCVDSPDPLTR